MRVRFAVAALLGAVLSLSSVWAQAPSRVYLEEMTWTELRAAIAAGKTTILVPIGGVEQSGPHMALGKHDIRAKALAGRIAAVLTDAIVAPVVAYVPEGNISPPTEHMRFPGTISVPEAVFESVLESAARSFRAAGFREIVFLGDHGGYQKSEAAVAAKLAREWKGTNFRVLALGEYYAAAQEGFAELLRAKGFSEAEIGSHAGLADTSLSLAIDPSLVRSEGLAARKPGPEEGVSGDPRRSSAELGQLGVDLIVARSASAIRVARIR